MLKRINDALPGLVLGILLYGVVIQFTGMWFAEDKLGYTIGLWYGIIIAVGMAINLATVILDSVTLDGGKNANRRIIAKSILRYVVVVVLFFILGYFRFGNLIAALVGVLGLKISAYLQPLLGKAANRLRGRGDASCPGETETDSADADELNADRGKINKEVTM
ncbi:MAG: hypothetical protein PUB52_06755 [Lachnospiraceae bacterium]|nr:hypothetical protein [Lachnospiraceae bacterium]